MTAALPAFVQPLSHSIYAVDTGFHRDLFDAAYLVVEAGHAIFIDTGTNYAVPRLLAALDALNVARDAVDWVIPTHVHLDHAGGAGLLMQQLPAARCLVHPRGARHLIDPSALVTGATAVYGDEEVQRSYGQILGIAAERVDTSQDGQVLNWRGRRLTLIDTPGHARHHHCVWDETSRTWFTGDTFGLSYREFDTARGPWLLPTTTPVQFEPEALVQSVQRMLAYQPDAICLTHYGRIGPDAALVQRLGNELLDQIQEIADGARPLAQHPNAADRHTALRHLFSHLMLRRVRLNGCTMSDDEALHLLAVDVELNAQGAAVWLDRVVG